MNIQYQVIQNQLLKWKRMPQGGVLYTPLDFNSFKRYPLIILVYEQQSNELMQYHRAHYSIGELSIVWIVNRGYLVFTPDIYFIIGSPGFSSLKSIDGAVNKLKQLPFVDSERVGIQGHSFGGWQVYHILSHSNIIFKAACLASGRNDLISSYNSLYGTKSAQEMGEQGQWRIGGTLWKKKQEYIDNSPILNADRIHTPLLILHNPRDKIVPFSQGLEMFLALRRLQKPCWLLQYKNSEHTLNDEDSKDFTEKMGAFFDYYLKDAPIPSWMESKQSVVAGGN